MRNDILFLTLRIFSATGGIEKVCRIMGKALYENTLQTNSKMAVCSMYDFDEDAVDNPYFPTEYFCGYGIHKLDFIQAMVRKGMQYDTLILSHINLLPIAWLLKKLQPKKKIILLAHGIEIWYPISRRRNKMLQLCDALFCVSAYTAEAVSKAHNYPATKTKVLNNCLDPFMPLPQQNLNTDRLLKKYGLQRDDQILMTLCRLSSKERYKGYEKVILAMAALKETFPNLKYVIAGSADEGEKLMIEALIRTNNLEGKVILAGYIKDEELEAHFKMCSIYIMPSKGEGFGVVFLEAMYFGLPVIAGNLDGSVDALDKGNLGFLIDPNNNNAIQNAIKEILEAPKKYQPNQERMKELFSYEVYKFKLYNSLT